MQPTRFLTRLSLLTLLLAALWPYQSVDAAGPEYRIVIRDHRFEPAELTVPAGQRIKLTIENADSTPEEFESHELNREKIIAGSSTGIVYIGPLAPGTYPFVGEFHEKTAQGRIVAR